MKHFLRCEPYFQGILTNTNKEFKLHLYSKRQTSDSSWEFRKNRKEKIKTAQKTLMDKKLRKTTNLCVEITNSRQQAKGT